MNYYQNRDAVLKAYPAPYYASFDINAAQPTPVTGWYNIRAMSSLDNVPPASSMIPLTEEQWNSYPYDLKACGLGVMGGKIVNYRAPIPPIPITTQAQNALDTIMSKASWVIARGQKFGPQTNYYIDSLIDITSGKITPQTLPECPSDLTQ